MERQACERQAIRVAEGAGELMSSQNDLRTSSQASAATEESQGEEAAGAKDSKRLLQNNLTSGRAETSAPKPKRRRTDYGNPRSSPTASPTMANTISNSTYSGQGRLNEMQRSFESYLAQPSVHPGLPHSVSDPSPLPIQADRKISTPKKRSKVYKNFKSTTQTPEKVQQPDQTTSTRAKETTAHNPKRRNTTPGTQFHPVELSDSDETADSATDSATDDERTPIRTRKKKNNIAGLDGANELEGDDKDREMERDTQVTLSDSAFESQEQGQEQRQGYRDAKRTRVEHRKLAYKAAREPGGTTWEGLISSGGGHGTEEVEL